MVLLLETWLLSSAEEIIRKTGKEIEGEDEAPYNAGQEAHPVRACPNV
jgi:hypothetical protein